MREPIDKRVSRTEVVGMEGTMSGENQKLVDALNNTEAIVIATFDDQQKQIDLLTRKLGTARQVLGEIRTFAGRQELGDFASKVFFMASRGRAELDAIAPDAPEPVIANAGTVIQNAAPVNSQPVNLPIDSAILPPCHISEPDDAFPSSGSSRGVPIAESPTLRHHLFQHSIRCTTDGVCRD